MKLNYFYKRAGVLGIMLILSCYLLYAQQGFSAYDIATKSSSYYPVSVTASQLFQKSPEEMDYCRGRATIRIPIYEIHSGGLTLPISLYYTTGGIRANQKNGPVAIGWQLEAEPMVTRMIRGKPDEVYYLTDGKLLEENNINYLLRVATGNADVQQDVFNYRLLSGSGKFMLKPSGNLSFKPIILSEEDVRIESSSTISTNFNNPIFITDSYGNRYTFGADYYHRETTFQVGTGEGVTAWKASKITSPDGDEITFGYNTNAPVERHSMRYDFYMVEDEFLKNWDLSSEVPPHPGYWKGINGKMNYYYLNGYEKQPNGLSTPVFKQWLNRTDVPYNRPGSDVQPRPIRNISFKGGSVDFYYNSSTKLLEEIRVYCGGSLQKRVSLITQQTYDPERYFLSEVRMYDSTGHSTGRYQLEYHIGYNYPKDQVRTDYWGYYCGGSADDMVPMQSVSFYDNTSNPPVNMSIGGTTGEGHYFYSLEYSLSKVTYPSGGTTEYLYESNEVHCDGSTYESPKRMTAGGLRLKSIIDNPEVGKNIVRTFKYGSWGKLNGIGFSAFPVCPQTFTQNLIKHYLLRNNVFGNYIDYTGRCRIYSNQNFVTSDCDIFYSNVCEEVDGIRTMHYFPANFQTSGSEEARYPTPIGYEAIQAHEDSCIYFRNAIPIEFQRASRSSTHGLVNEVKPRAIFDKIISTSDINDGIRGIFLKSYSIRQVDVYHKNSKLSEVCIRKSDKKTLLEKRQMWNYGISTAKQLVDIESDNEKVEFSYPRDSPSKAAHAIMLQRNDVATPVETRHYVDGALRKRIRYEYAVDTRTNRGYSLSSILESTNSSGTELRVAESYGDYLTCGKPSQVTMQDGRIVCLVWAKEGDWLLASIEGMTAKQVNAAGVDLMGISHKINIPYSTYNQLDEFRLSHPEARVITYRYQPTGELSTKRGADGVAEHYTYDGSGRLKEIWNNQLKTISKYEYHEANE